MAIRVACQTYSWEMLGQEYTGTVDDILDAVAAAGFEGVEIASTMFGSYRDRPEAFARAASDRHLVLASIAHSSANGWTAPDGHEQDVTSTEQAIDWALRAGSRLVGLGGAAAPSDLDREEALRRACTRYDEVCRMGSERHAVMHVHPHSHAGSVIESDDEYEYLLEHTNPTHVRFGPDVGHIMRGGGDYLGILERHRDRVLHLHLKDMYEDGRWAPLGEGVCDLKALVDLLHRIGYDGWLVLEEESAAARKDPAAAIRRSRETLREYGL